LDGKAPHYQDNHLGGKETKWQKRDLNFKQLKEERKGQHGVGGGGGGCKRCEIKKKNGGDWKIGGPYENIYKQTKFRIQGLESFVK